MKLIFLAILALIIASALAYQVHLEPGYALLTYGEMSIETSLAVLVFLTLIVFVVFYVALRTLMTIKRTPKNIGKWNTKRKQNRSRKELNKGLIDSAEGNWQRSEKLLIKHAQQSDAPLLNYLSAAHAAQSQQAYERRDEYLFKAGEALPEQMHAIHLTRAKLQLSAGQIEQALATLQQLRTTTPGHPIVLTLLMKAHRQLNDWEALYNLLPAIKNNRKISQEEWLQIEQDTLLNLFQGTSTSSSQDLKAVWKSLNKSQRLHPTYLFAYASQLINSGKGDIAESLLVKGLSTQTDARLLALYSQLNIPSDKKIKQLEKWLRKHTTSAELLNTIAELHIQKEQWSEAKTYLENSISVTPTSLAYLLLGKLNEQQGDATDEANANYKAGLELSLNTNSVKQA